MVSCLMPMFQLGLIVVLHNKVALERVKEYSELPREPPEFIEPRPPASWPSSGEIQCEGLVIRYAVCRGFLYLGVNY